jgi:hypothetical protein
VGFFPLLSFPMLSIFSILVVILTLFFGQIDLNLEVCISNFNVYGTVTLAVTVTVKRRRVARAWQPPRLAVRRNQRPMTSPTVSSS